jgi:hypothetical protein
MDVTNPTIGRIVIYHHAGSADGKFPPKISPAIVQAVNIDNTLELVVFSSGNGNGIFFANGVSFNQGDNKTSWSWPVRT